MRQSRSVTLRRALAVNLCIAALVAAAFGMDIMRAVNRSFEDMLYQNPVPLDGSVVVIGIDARALEQVGAWPWDRGVMAKVIALLNLEPEHRPAAIGVDVIYSGYTNSASDMALVRAAAAGNVVVSCAGEFGTRFQQAADGSAYMDGTALIALLNPYEELAQAAFVGHTNAMYDADGILRHHLWSIPNGDGGEIPSMSYQLYALYQDYWGMPSGFLPTRDARGFWHVDFSAKPGTYFEYSVSDILNQNFDPQVLEGAAVLIGPYDMGLHDDYVTAADHAERMYGVEYLANVLTAMLAEKNKVEVPREPQLALLFLLCGTLGTAFFIMRLGWAFGLYLLSAAGSIGACLMLYEKGYLFHPLWIPAALSLCFLASVAAHYYAAQREKRSIRKTFQRYVDPAILQELLREGMDTLALGGKTVDIAVLFVDLRGFTALSESMESQKVVEILNEYLSMTSMCIYQNGGTLDKFIGDCTMAFWGAPLPCHDPIFQACRAATDIQNAAADLEKSVLEKHGVSIHYGVGIHYGSAVVGNIGAADRMDYTAIGDTVNTASRLESYAPADTIYISRIVADALGKRAETTSLGDGIRLKGKTIPFEILTLDALTVNIEKEHFTV